MIILCNTVEYYITRLFKIPYNLIIRGREMSDKTRNEWQNAYNTNKREMSDKMDTVKKGITPQGFYVVFRQPFIWHN